MQLTRPGTSTAGMCRPGSGGWLTKSKSAVAAVRKACACALFRAGGGHAGRGPGARVGKHWLRVLADGSEAVRLRQRLDVGAQQRPGAQLLEDRHARHPCRGRELDEIEAEPQEAAQQPPVLPRLRREQLARGPEDDAAPIEELIRRHRADDRADAGVREAAWNGGADARVGRRHIGRIVGLGNEAWVAVDRVDEGERRTGKRARQGMARCPPNGEPFRMPPIVGVGGPPPVQERILPCRKAVTKKIDPVAVDAEFEVPAHHPGEHLAPRLHDLFRRRLTVLTSTRTVPARPRAVPAGRAGPLRFRGRPPRGSAGS